MTRVLSAAAFLPIVFGVIWFLAPIWTLAFAEVLLLLAVIEYSGIAARTDAPFTRITTATAAAVSCAALSLVPSQFPAVLMVAGVGIAVVELSRSRQRAMLAPVSAALLTLPYLALPLGALAAIRAQSGREVLVLFLVTVMASDTAQYYGGRAFGRRPLAPTISPKKTVAGAVFGFAAGMVVLGVAGEWWLPGLDVGFRVLLGAMIAGLGIVGDLFESSLKRAADLKDASALIPGHGGILDRLDGILFAAPVYYAIVHLTT